MAVSSKKCAENPVGKKMKTRADSKRKIADKICAAKAVFILNPRNDFTKKALTATKINSKGYKEEGAKNTETKTEDSAPKIKISSSFKKKTLMEKNQNETGALKPQKDIKLISKSNDRKKNTKKNTGFNLYQRIANLVLICEFANL